MMATVVTGLVIDAMLKMASVRMAAPRVTSDLPAAAS